MGLMLLMAVLSVGRAQSAAGPPRWVDPVPAPRQDGVLLNAQSVEAGNLINVVQARTTYGVNGAGLTVAVLDTGIRPTHVDFAGRLIAQQNFTADNGGNPTNATDGSGHGTNVSGVIAANGTHTGMAPGANVAALKVLDNSGNGQFSAVESALDWVIANRVSQNITVVNMSLGDGGNYTNLPNDAIATKIATLRAARVAVCVESGDDYFSNGSVQGMAYPAIFPGTVSVGAVYDANIGSVTYGDGAIAFSTAADRICPFSQRLHPSGQFNNRTDVLAPGAAITSTGNTGDTSSSTQQSTSQAAPVVAGVILLLQEYYRDATGQLPTVDQLETWLRFSGDPVLDGDDENDNVVNTNQGYPRVNALASLQAVEAVLGVTYNISGAVTVNGIGLSGVTVTAGVVTTTTAANGTYTLSGLGIGDYTVTPSRAGYSFAPANRLISVGPDQTGVNFAGTLLNYSVSGTVLLDGAPLADVTVTDGTRTVTTNALGQYTLLDVPPGSHTITPTLAGYTFSPPSVSVTVTLSNLTGVDFTAAPKQYRIAGQLLSNGVGVAGISVSVGGTSVVTGAGGNYEVGGLLAGSYLVQPTSPGYTYVPNTRNITVGPDRTDANFTATRVFQISGRVTADGAGVPGVTVTNGTRTTTTNASGDYVLANLTAGSHTITPSGLGYTYTPASRTVLLATSDVANTNFTGSTLPSLQSITPRVLQLIGGKSTSITALFNLPVTANTVVTLTSSAPKAKVPKKVVIKKNKSSAKFMLRTRPVTADLTVTITATSGGVTRTAVVTVLPRPSRN